MCDYWCYSVLLLLFGVWLRLINSADNNNNHHFQTINKIKSELNFYWRWYRAHHQHGVLCVPYRRFDIREQFILFYLFSSAVVYSKLHLMLWSRCVTHRIKVRGTCNMCGCVRYSRHNQDLFHYHSAFAFIVFPTLFSMLHWKIDKTQMCRTVLIFRIFGKSFFFGFFNRMSIVRIESDWKQNLVWMELKAEQRRKQSLLFLKL